MSKPFIVTAAVLAFAATAVAALFYFMRTPPTPPPPPVAYGQSWGKIISEYFERGFDTDNDGKLSYDEFVKGYAHVRLNKSEREVYDAKEAFELLDVNRDGSVDRTDAALLDKYRDGREYMKRREDLARQGLIPMYVEGVEVLCNPLQREWIEAEGGAAKRDELPFGGVFFAARSFGSFETINRPKLLPLLKLTRSYWGRVTLIDGRSVDGFVRDPRKISGDSTLAAGRVYVLTADARISVHAFERVLSVDYVPDSAAERYIRAVAQTPISDTTRQIEIARQCVKDGMTTEAQQIYRRVLVFEHDNAEALKALGYKLNGRQYIKVE